MEAPSLLHHLNFNPRRNLPIKCSLLNAIQTPTETSNPPPLRPSSNKFSNSSPISRVKARHAQIVKTPNEDDSYTKVQSLIISYLELSDFESAAMLFFVGYAENYLHWNYFLEDFTSSGGEPLEILQVFVRLQNMGIIFGSEILSTVLKLCANSGEPWLGMDVHACLIKRGFVLDMYSRCALMNFYGKSWGLDAAYKIFNETSGHDTSSLLWNEVVMVTLRNESWLQGLQLFRQMQFSSVKGTSLTICKILQACAKVEALDQGRQLHGYVIRNMMESSVPICNSLINMYLRNGSIGLARAVSDRMENRNLSTWNSIISGYAAFGHLKEALEMLHDMESCKMKPDIVTWNSILSGHLHHRSSQVLNILQNMQKASFKPNSRTITTVLQAVSELCHLNLGKEIHCYAVRTGLHSDIYVGTSLIDMYAKNNDLNSARAVFDNMIDRNIVTWNSMISGYSCKVNCEKAISLFEQMKEEGIRPDLVTYNAMVSGYSMAGCIHEALNMMKEIKNSGLTPNVVSWTALISGISQNGYHKEALEFCNQMQRQGIKPNESTIASVLKVCACLSLLQKGKEAHCFSIRNGYTEDTFVCTTLIDMYSKCGDSRSAYHVFRKVPNKTVASWNSMMMGFSMNGHGKDAIALFHRMLDEKLQPDAITMTALLLGCRHSGMIDDAWKYFDRMEAEYGLTPTIQHYSCMVDLLGRGGYLDEAWDFIKQMPLEPDATVWGTVLQSCRIHGNIQLGEVAAKQLFRMEPKNPANYVLLMSLYAVKQRWDDVDLIKELMDTRSIKLGNNWSWIEINKTVHTFSAVGNHDEDGEIYFELYQLISDIKKRGYIPDTRCVYYNVNEEEKQKVLLLHTEKMAITYGLIKTKTNTPIRVIQNTRICADCHTFAKYISLARKRKIILKDRNHLHHFTEGVCSCRDFW